MMLRASNRDDYYHVLRLSLGTPFSEVAVLDRGLDGILKHEVKNSSCNSA